MFTDLSQSDIITTLTLAGLVGATVLAIWKYGGKVFRAFAKSVWPKIRLLKRIAMLELMIPTLQANQVSITQQLETMNNRQKEMYDEIVTNGRGLTLKAALHGAKETQWTRDELDGHAVWETRIMPNGEFGCVRYTSSLEKLIGVKADGNGWTSALHPEEALAVQAAWKNALENETGYDQPQRFVIYDRNRRISKIVYTISKFVPERDMNGKFIGGIGHLLEITADEWKERHNAIHETR